MVAVAAEKHDFISVDEYLEGERISDIKHEFIDGQAYAMAGASMNYNHITNNISREFGNHLEPSPCAPCGSDMKVKAGEDFYYPDFMVVCDDNEENEYYRTSPVIIVEVLSSSTHKTDKTIKKDAYLSIPSLQEYVLIAQDIADIEVFRKSANWFPEHYFLGDEVTFESIGLTLSVVEIYGRVQNDEVLGFLNYDTNSGIKK